jgi:CyaY protein
VVNSHRAARQIWMAADRSAWHFDLAEGAATGEGPRWIAAKTGEDLHTTLAATIGKRLGRTIQLR